MAKLDYLIIHCTATLNGVNITKEDIIRWHTAPVSEGGRGWKALGYSDMIHINGGLENLTPFNQDGNVDPWEITNGVRGVNGRARHLAYVGGTDYDYSMFGNGFSEEEELPRINVDTRTIEQIDTMGIYILYMIKRHPDIKVAGHDYFSSKDCPCFNVPLWLEFIGVDEKNILR